MVNADLQQLFLLSLKICCHLKKEVPSFAEPICLIGCLTRQIIVIKMTNRSVVPSLEQDSFGSNLLRRTLKIIS